MNLSGAGPQGDQVYGGDMAMWAKFGNSLKLRVAMRMADASPATAQAAAEAALFQYAWRGATTGPKPSKVVRCGKSVRK